MKLSTLYNQVLVEEFIGNDLYGHHVTTRANLESIRDDGFKIGHRSMQGKGIYAFYDLNHAIRYGRKGEIPDPIIIKFKITSPRTLIYLNMDIAKKVLGSEYSLKDQINRKIWDTGEGLEGFIKGVRLAYKRDITMDELIEKLDYIETHNDEMTQRNFWAMMIPSTWNDKLNIILDGYYGIEFRINHPKLMYVVGYYDLSSDDINELIPIEKDLIPSDSEYDELRKLSQETGYDLVKLQRYLEQLQYKTRNNHDYDYFDDLIDKIDKILY